MKEKKTIYYMENRGWGFVYHFFIFTIGGLRHFEEKNPIIYIPYMRPKLKEFDEKILRSLGYDENELNTTRDFPANYDWKNIEINYEICNLLKDKYQFVFTLEDFPNLDDYTIEKSIGDKGEDGKKTLCFLKNLFEEIIGTEPLNNETYVYITRKGSETISLHGGKKVRCILNEDELIKGLHDFNFQYVQLETLPFVEKIKLFQRAKIILAPNSAALMFCIFCNKESLVIEMIPSYNVGEYKTHWDQRQYENMCRIMSIPYHRFQHFSHVEDYLNGNIRVDILKEFLNSFQKI